MTCLRCGERNPSQARFCMACGASLAVACAACGTELPAAAAFCFACGHAVGQATGGATRLAAPASYTPKHLAERILTSKAALEGERKQVTVLFADLKGSMELLADRDPEEARKLLDPVLAHMMEAVLRYEGTVNQVMGDGIMALFGAPLAHEDHAVRACYAALRMQDAVRVPASVQAILAARIDRLAAEDKRLLQAASAVGKDVPLTLLDAVGGLDEGALRAALGRLEAAEFVYEARLYPELEFTFKHALTHEVAYGSLLHERRVALHAAILAAMERLHADRLAEHVEVLAHHAHRGERWPEAIAYARRAAARAFSRSAYAESVARLEQALATIERLAPGAERAALELDLVQELRRALFPLADAGRAAELASRAEALASDLGDQRRLGGVYNRTGNALL